MAVAGLHIKTTTKVLLEMFAETRANKIDWQMPSEIWTNILVAPSGSMLRGEQPPVQGGKLIHYLIAADKMTEEEISDIQREYNVAHGRNIDAELLALPKPIAETSPMSIGE